MVSPDTGRYEWPAVFGQSIRLPRIFISSAPSQEPSTSSRDTRLPGSCSQILFPIHAGNPVYCEPSLFVFPERKSSARISRLAPEKKRNFSIRYKNTEAVFVRILSLINYFEETRDSQRTNRIHQIHRIK